MVVGGKSVDNRLRSRVEGCVLGALSPYHLHASAETDRQSRPHKGVSSGKGFGEYESLACGCMEKGFRSGGQVVEHRECRRVCRGEGATFEMQGQGHI